MVGKHKPRENKVSMRWLGAATQTIMHVFKPELLNVQPHHKPTINNAHDYP